MIEARVLLLPPGTPFRWLVLIARALHFVPGSGTTSRKSHARPSLRAVLRGSNFRSVVLGLALLALAIGCGDLTRTDSRFATPERTVATLLGAHGAGQSTQAELHARMVSEGGLAIVDRATYEACFVDLGEPGGEALAAYVLGMIAAARDELRYETIEQHGYVVARDGARVAMRRGDDGAYRIVLRESVPVEAQRTLLELGSSPPRRDRGR